MSATDPQQNEALGLAFGLDEEGNNLLALRLRKRDWALHLGLILPALAVEWIASLSFLDRIISLQNLLWVHGAVVAVILGVFLWTQKHDYDPIFLLLLLIFTASMGPFGPMIILLSFIVFWRYSKERRSFADWFASLFPEEDLDETEELFQRILSGRDDLSEKGGIMSFQDVFVVGTLAQKRLALTKIAKHFRKDFAPALRMALTDESNAIRVQAATVAARIEQSFVSDLMRLTQQHKKQPTDAEVLLQLARQTDNYSYSGILDGERLEDMIQLTITYYQGYLELRPEDYQTRFILGRILLHHNQAEEAQNAFWACINEGGMDQPSVHVWYLQALFQLRDFWAIHEYMENYQMPVVEPGSMASLAAEFGLLEFWKKGASAKELKLEMQ
ncbi:MAG: hypothetical protein RRB13_02095 [bacterium]|nr:hypothetical protein [bacterium]